MPPVTGAGAVVRRRRRTGLGPEDVPHRPHRAASVIRLGPTTTFVELKNTDPEAAVEEEGELG